MMSPLRDPHQFKCVATLKELIPAKSVVSSYLFYDGNIELGLAGSDRFVVAHTNNYVISEFWACARFDPARVIQIAEHVNEERDPRMMYLMQESWPKYKDPFVRSALFFLLNRYSEEGYPSAGKLNFANYNPLIINRLKGLKNLENFHLYRTKEENFLVDLCSSSEHISSDFILIPAGKFHYNLFDHGKTTSHENTAINHNELSEKFKEFKRKSLLIYKNHPKLFDVYKDYNIKMINKHGRPTSNKDNSEELIIANF